MMKLMLNTSFREIKYLKCFNNENIINILDTMSPLAKKLKDYNDVYIVMHHANNAIYFAIVSFPCNVVRQLDTISIIIYYPSVVEIIVWFISDPPLSVAVRVGISYRCCVPANFSFFSVNIVFLFFYHS